MEIENKLFIKNLQISKERKEKFSLKKALVSTLLENT